MLFADCKSALGNRRIANPTEQEKMCFGGFAIRLPCAAMTHGSYFVCFGGFAICRNIL